MTNGSFDNIWSILQNLAERQSVFQQQQDRSQQQLDLLGQKIDGLTEKQDRSQQQLDQLVERQDRSQQADLLGRKINGLGDTIRQKRQSLTENLAGILNSLTHDINATTTNLNGLIGQSSEFTAQTNALMVSEQRDRAEFRRQMLGLQTETRNILRELTDLRRQQQGNGDRG